MSENLDDLNNMLAAHKPPSMTPERAGAIFADIEAQQNSIDMTAHMHEVEQFARRNGLLDDSPSGQILREITGVDPKSASVLTDDPAYFAGLGNAAAAGQAPGQEHAQANGQANQNGALELPPPTSFESSLASIKMSDKRQERFVILGDPAIRDLYYDTLAERGLLKHKDGVPVINLKREAAVRILQEVTSKVHGAESSHALSLKLDRDSHGVVGGLVAGVKNALGRQHQIDVVVVGSRELVQEKLTEMGSLLSKMDENKMFTPARGANDSPAVPLHADGRLAVPEKKPVELEGSVKLSELLYVVKSSQYAYKQQEYEKELARREQRAATENEAIRSTMGGGPDAATSRQSGAQEGAQAGAQSSAQVASSPATSKEYASATQLAQDLRTGVAAPESLKVANEKGFTAADDVLRNARNLSAAGFQALSSAERQELLTNLTAVVEKAADKEYGRRAASFLTQTEGKDGVQFQSMREKLDVLVAAEKQADPSFAERLKANAQDLQQRGVLSESQAQRVAGEVPSAAAAQDVSRSVQNTTSATSTAPEIAPSTPSSAPKPDAASATSGEASTFRGRIEDIAKAGPTALTEEKASAVIAELDALRAKPLHALDSQQGAKPTETLVRLDGILQEISSNRFGPVLAAQASDLQGAMQGWHKQNEERYAREQGALPLVAQADAMLVKAQESAWHPATAPAERSAQVAPEARQEARAEAPAAMKPESRIEAERLSPNSTQATPGQATEKVVASRQADTEAALQQMSRLMENPAGSFTTREKRWDEPSYRSSWNEPALQSMAKAIDRLDVAAVAAMEPSERTKAAGYATWFADAATTGKLPSFDSERGRELANKAADKAAALIDLVTPNSLSKSTEQELTKAGRLVDAMEQRGMGMVNFKESQQESTRSAAPVTPVSTKEAVSVAKDLVHAVYNKSEMTESDVRYLMKNADKLDANAIKSLSPEMQAKTAVALNFLSDEVKKGAMGEFSELNKGLQASTERASKVGQTMTDALSKDPSMLAPLTKAHIDLNNKLDGHTAEASTSSGGRGTSVGAQHGQDGAPKAGAKSGGLER